jgi:hypothetical protein
MKLPGAGIDRNGGYDALSAVQLEAELQSAELQKFIEGRQVEDRLLAGTVTAYVAMSQSGAVAGPGEAASGQAMDDGCSGHDTVPQTLQSPSMLLGSGL